MKTLGITTLRHSMRDVISRILAGETLTLTNYQRPLATISPYIPRDRYEVFTNDRTLSVYCAPCGETIPCRAADIIDLNHVVTAHNTTHHQGDER